MGIFRTLRLGNIALTPQYVARIYHSAIKSNQNFDKEDLIINICLDRYKDSDECADKLLQLHSLVNFDLKKSGVAALMNEELTFLNLYLSKTGINGDLTLIVLAILIAETTFLQQDNKTQSEWVIEIATELESCKVPQNLIVTTT